MTKTELYFQLRLISTPGIGNVFARKLIQFAGSAQLVFTLNQNQIKSISNIGNVVFKNLQKPLDFETEKRIENELIFLENEDINVYSIFDDNYPLLLKNCSDAPILLFVKGNINFKNKKIISIIGTRNLTKYGADFCSDFIEQLVKHDPIIVSGLAYGTDILAHKLAIKHNLQTIAVLPCGFKNIYPKEHEIYSKDIINNGAFITEFWSNQFAEKENFIKRNRIVAGISQATVLIESAEKGGSLVTAKFANEYNRDVFALPGRITDKYSIGCNNLIKNFQASILTNELDLVKGLNWDVNKSVKKVIQPQLFLDLSELDQKILSLLETNGKNSSDIIAASCNEPISKINSCLLQLELLGLVRSLPGNNFEKI